MKHKFHRLSIYILLVLFLASAVPAGGMASSLAVHANSSAFDFLPDLSEYQDQLAEFFSGVDEEVLPEVFDFLQEKAGDGSLKSESGIEEAIKEGQEKFGGEIEGKLSEQHIKSMVELATTLEDMGFSGESIIEKSRAMYEEYGTNFVNHFDELVTEAVKDSIGNMIKNALNRFWQMIGNFFKDLINSFK
ncbi:MAG: hypothetical protein FWG91_10765 [Lachnospiraceae bacterium]|nr:hypothetical protein [Lachnospiraceae bacterium]